MVRGKFLGELGNDVTNGQNVTLAMIKMAEAIELPLEQ